MKNEKREISELIAGMKMRLEVEGPECADWQIEHAKDAIYRAELALKWSKSDKSEFKRAWWALWDAEGFIAGTKENPQPWW